ncbi:MAG TPA: hypothetical protein VF898_10820 [Chloroflexota bacterium]
MRRSLVATTLILASTVALAFSGSLTHGFAQVGGPQGDEFNLSTFQAPFKAVCATYASKPCPDQAGTGTWSVNSESPGNLRIWSNFGSLVGTLATNPSTNTARNMILQPVDPNVDWTVTTRMTFPAAASSGSPLALGQTAGLIDYQDDDNFIYLGQDFVAGAAPQLEFVQEIAGNDYKTAVPLTGVPPQTFYLRLQKSGTSYTAFYSTDNVNFTQIGATLPTATVTTTPTGTGTSTPGTATATPGPAGYTASYTAPQLGLFSWGGTDARVNQNLLAADFDWFRVGSNSQTPAPTVAATSTNTPITTSTATATATSTLTATPTNPSTPTNTPVPPTPTPTPKPAPKPSSALEFQYVSLWYHVVKQGTWDVINIQANHKRQLGIWAHVYFPNGKHLDWFTLTDSHGHWLKRFNIPYRVTTKHSNQAVITLRLWEGKKSRMAYVTFTLV